MGHPTKVQVIQRKNNEQWYVNFPAVVAHALEFGKGEIVAEFDIKPDLWFFNCHFEGDPVMPGCLGLDSLWQLVGFFLGWKGGQGRGRALSVGEVKFS